MVKVQRFFKKTEHKPFTYPSIEERRTSPNYFIWVIGIVLIAGIGLIVFLIF